MLMLHANRLVPVERLIEAVWDDDPPATATTQVRNRISELRRAWTARLSDPARVLTTHGNGYLLHTEGHSLDLMDFERDLAHAHATDDHAEAVRLLRSALSHWRGSKLVGFDGRLLTDAATELEERRLSAIEECTGHELALGRHAYIVAELTALTDAHPFRERLVEHLMLALYRSGRQVDALACYRRCAQRLREDLGLEPVAALRELHATILRQAPRRSQPSTVDTAKARPAELLTDIADFTGRQSELDQLAALLAPVVDGPSGGVPIIVITGTAGVGKTALATHWAHQIVERFPDGQLLLELQGYAQGPPVRPIDALATALRTLGVRTDQVPADLDEASRLLRSLLAGKRMLLMLDNARDAEQLRPLLPGTPGCLVLITSRDRLAGLVASHGARRLTVEPLHADDATALLARILGPVRVKAEQDAVAGLVDACASLPLALRIAAANLDSLGHRSIGDYLLDLRDGDRLAALRIEGDSQAVKSVFDASYGALPADARRMLRLISSSPGPDIGMPAVAALARVDTREAAVLVDRLAAVHLVHRTSSGRCTTHDLLRLYGQQQEPQAERRARIAALLDWYLDHARAAARLLHPHMLRLSDAQDGPPADRFDGVTSALAWLDLELPNLIAAVEYAAAHGPHRVAWLMPDALRGYFWLRGNTVGWLHTASLGLDAARTRSDLKGQAVTHLALAFARFSQGHYQVSIEQYRTVLDLSRRAAWPEGQATALGNLGLAHASAGELRPAVRCLESAATIDRRTGRRLGLATTLCTLGQVHIRLGRLDEALRHLQEASALYRAADSHSGLARALVPLALVTHLLDLPVDVVGHCQQALAIYQSTGDRDGEASALSVLARILCGTGQAQTAQTHANAAWDLITSTGRHRQGTSVLNTLGHVQLALGNPNEAYAYHWRAMAAANPADSHYDVVEAYIGVATTLHQLTSNDSALHRARCALDLAHRAEYRLIEGDALSVLASIHRVMGSVEEAVAHGQSSLVIYNKIGHHAGARRVLAILGNVTDKDPVHS